MKIHDGPDVHCVSPDVSHDDPDVHDGPDTHHGLMFSFLSVSSLAFTTSSNNTLWLCLFYHVRSNTQFLIRKQTVLKLI